MTNSSRKVIPILRVIDGSILTFECVITVSSIIDNSIIFELEDSLPRGLSYINDSEVISYSTDCGATYISYNDLIYCCCFDTTDNKLQIILASPRPSLNPLPESGYNKYIFVKINFKVIVNSLSTLGSILINTGEIYGNFWYQDAIGVYDLPPKGIILCDYLIEKYSFIVIGYSLNVCDSCLKNLNYSKEFEKDFTAIFSFNALSGDYGTFDINNKFTPTSKYVLTIRPTKGIRFPINLTDLENIEVSIDKISLYFNAQIDDNNLIITIPHVNTITTSNDNFGCKLITVTIPYEIYHCVPSPYIIKGSIELIDTDNNKILSSLHSFCLCVNTQCSDLIEIRENLLC